VFERDEPEGRLGHDFPDESVAGGTGAEYGNWWHEMMETAPWESGIESWREYARNALSKCPDVDRGRRELDLFTVSACAAMLFEDGASIHTEAPVLWRADESLAYEGLIDLVGSNRSNGKWFVVDWKTDRLSGDTCQLLRDRYGPQIRVYGEAVSSICETETEAWIYSTVSGELISVT
jgi:ATP-dependent exoDNAse (exonuclease V) beta subunit